MKKQIQLCVLAFVSAIGVASVQAQLQTNTAPAKAEWKSSVAAGLTLTRGNGETTLGTLTAASHGKWDSRELTIGADGAYGESKTAGQTESTVTSELLHGFVQYNWLFTDRFYGLGRAEGLHDGVADIRYRATFSVGAGYYLIKTTNTDLSAEVGPGYLFQKLGDDTSDYATLRFGEKFHQALSSHARLWQSAEFLPQVRNFENYIVNAEIGIEADLRNDKKLALRSYITDTFNSEPALGRKQNDLTWVTAIAYKF